MLERETFLGDKLAQLLAYDVLFGQGVRGKFKGTMKRNYESLNKALEHYMQKYGCEKREDLQKIYEDKAKEMQMIKPKYIYLNTLVHDKKVLIEKLKSDKFIRIKNTLSNENADNEESTANLKAILKSLKNFQYIKDEHVKNMLVFAADSLINKSYYLFNEGHLMQIDKVIHL